ncbi:MAG TPA: hypothetical protein VMH28_07735 [Candidatus Acidoferrales bacterium]|nr:hypothetical protein [Candidatus Acidoferrales bacterium]
MKLCLCLVVLACTLAGADKIQSETLRGKLIIQPGQQPSVETPDHRRILLDGDQPTRKVLQDERVSGFEMEARGHFTAPDRFAIDPQHTRALLVRDHGRLKMITYWCDVCGIRAYTPGPCVCCQKETTLDLRDPNDIQ